MMLMKNDGHPASVWLIERSGGLKQKLLYVSRQLRPLFESGQTQ
jgi:hypothetical protein